MRSGPYNGEEYRETKCWEIRRSSWPSHMNIRMLKGYGMMATEGRVYWEPSPEDLIARDWEVPDRPTKAGT